MTTWRLRVPSRETDNRYFIANTMEECEKALRIVEGARGQEVGVDTEGVGVNLRKFHAKGRFRVVSLQLSTSEVPFIFIPNWGEHEGKLRVFRKWLEDDKTKKVLANAKSDMHFLANHGITMRGLAGDTQIMDWVFDSGRQFHGLKEIARDYCGIEMVEYKETFKRRMIKKNGKEGKSWIVPPLTEVVETQEGIDKLVKYACLDPHATRMAYLYLKKKLDRIEWCSRGSMWDYYQQFELPFTEVLFRMERRGMYVDMAAIDEIEARITDDMVDEEANFLHLAKKRGVSMAFLEDFNMGSPKQLVDFFEEQLGLEIPLDKKGKPSTGDANLRRLKGCKKIVDSLMRIRKLAKLLGTYVNPYRRDAPDYGGRIHTTLKQTGTVTGRLSSSAQNLQNVPRPGEDSTDKYLIRSAFAAPPGRVIVDADLSQIELRLAAHFSNDPSMLQAYKEGWDLHTLTATKIDPDVKKWLGMNTVTQDLLAEVKKQFPTARDRSKPINFGVIYGMTEYRYAAVTGQSVDAARQGIMNFMGGYPGLKREIKRTIDHARTHGYVRTLIGRYAMVPDIASEKEGTRRHGERACFNYKIQGSASDLMKMAMILIDRDEKLNRWGYEMELQVHDELMGECPEENAKRVTERKKKIMGEPHIMFGMKPLRLETPASGGFGANWMQAK